MKRTEAMAYYGRIMDRIEAWERSESERLRNEILVPHFAGNMCCLHNWMLNYEDGSFGGCITKEVYKLGKFYNWKQNQIWAASRKLKDHFWAKWIETSRRDAA